MLDWIIVAIFYAIFALILILNRKRIEVLWKVGFVLKTRRGIKIIDKLAKIPVIWDVLSTIGVVLSIFLVFATLFMISYSFFSPIMSGEVPNAQAAVILPYKSPILFSLILLIIIHELSHGIVARVKGVRIKSLGVGVLTFLPLAFVEVDDEDLKRIGRLDRMRIFCMGSFANILAFFAFSLFLSNLYYPFLLNQVMEAKGVMILDVFQGMPAAKANVTKGAIIHSVNNFSVHNLSEFREALSKVKPGENVTLQTSKGKFVVKTTQHPRDPNKAYLGVSLSEYYDVREGARERFGILVDFFSWFASFLLYAANLNLLVGLVNLLPLLITDGSKLLYDFLDYISPNQKVKLYLFNFINSFTIFLFIALLFLSMFSTGVTLL